MQINNLTKNELNTLMELYLEHKKDFYDYKELTIEDFAEQFCRRCDTCGRIICVLDMCEECDEKEEEDNEFAEFELNKEHILYGI